MCFLSNLSIDEASGEMIACQCTMRIAYILALACNSCSSNDLFAHTKKFIRKRLMELEYEHHTNLLKVSEDAEAELQQKDNQLAVVEAKLCQLRIQVDNERRISQKAAPDMGLDQVQELDECRFDICICDCFHI